MTEYWKSYYLAHSKTRLFQKRIDFSFRVIDNFMSVCDRPYIGFSGGKDSSAMLILYQKLGLINIPVFTQADDFDWEFKEPTCRRIIKHLGFTDYTYQQASESVLEQIRVMDFLQNDFVKIDSLFFGTIENFYKQRKLNGYSIGIRIQESNKRKFRILTAGQVAKTKSGLWSCYPMGNLKGEDIFALIISNGLPYMEIYDKHNERPPHELRFSWVTNPELFHLGVVVWLKQNYPEHFNKLCVINPKIRCYV